MKLYNFNDTCISFRIVPGSVCYVMLSLHIVDKDYRMHGMTWHHFTVQIQGNDEKIKKEVLR